MQKLHYNWVGNPMSILEVTALLYCVTVSWSTPVSILFYQHSQKIILRVKQKQALSGGDIETFVSATLNLLKNKILLRIFGVKKLQLKWKCRLLWQKKYSFPFYWRKFLANKSQILIEVTICTFQDSVLR